MSEAPATPPPAGRATKVLYGIGAVAFGVKDNGFSYFLLFFYSQIVGLPAGLVSAALMLVLIADAVIDVGIGQLSDNWRSRLGRRHPFMYAAALPAAGGYMLLWNPPKGSEVFLLGYLTVTTVVVRAFLSAYEIPSSALVAELSSDYHERTSFFSYRYFFAVWGGTGLTLLALRVLMRPDKLHPVGQLNPSGYSLYGLVAGAAMLASILISAGGTHRRIRYLRQPPPRRTFSLREVAGEMFSTLTTPSLIAITLAAIASAVAAGIGAGLGLYVNTYFWELSADQLSLLLPAGMIGATIGVAMAPHMASRFGKRDTAIMLAIVSVIVTLAPLALRLVGWFPPNGSPALVPLLFVSQFVAIVLGICANVLISAMLIDVVEESELKTGRRSEGLVMASNTFVAKCVSGVGIFAAGLVVSVVNFPAHAVPGKVSPDTVRNLVLVYMLVQAVFYFAAIYLLSRYRITEGGHAANLKLLAERQQLAPAPLEEIGAGGSATADALAGALGDVAGA